MRVTQSMRRLARGLGSSLSSSHTGKIFHIQTFIILLRQIFCTSFIKECFVMSLHGFESAVVMTKLMLAAVPSLLITIFVFFKTGFLVFQGLREKSMHRYLIS